MAQVKGLGHQRRFVLFIPEDILSRPSFLLCQPVQSVTIKQATNIKKYTYSLGKGNDGLK